MVLDGLPAGLIPDEELIKHDLSRRAPRTEEYSTSRKESDDYRVLSGLYEGRLTGTPLCVFFPNTDARPNDYGRNIARPSHADYPAFIKFNGFSDQRGGGHFSGRLTAPLVFAGALAKQILKKDGIFAAAHILSIGKVFDEPFDAVNLNEDMLRLPDPYFPLINQNMKEPMLEAVKKARASGTSLGGIAECAVTGIPAGAGEPFFDSVESCVSHLLFSIPGVKGVEFGSGFEIASMFGHEANDPLFIENGRVKTKTNHSGGINGGLTNGMPVIVRAAFRPVSSVAVCQQSVDLDSMQNAELQIKGRYDACFVPRAVPAVEAACALAVLDLLWRDRNGSF
jgi:chorismate synthase